MYYIQIIVTTQIQHMFWSYCIIIFKFVGLIRQRSLQHYSHKSIICMYKTCLFVSRNFSSACYLQSLNLKKKSSKYLNYDRTFVGCSNICV